jgi:hypothetical protein
MPAGATLKQEATGLLQSRFFKDERDKSANVSPES